MIDVHVRQEDTQTHRRESHQQKLERPTGFRRSMALSLHILISDFSLQNCATIHFYCFCATLLRQPQETNRQPKSQKVAKALRQSGKESWKPEGLFPLFAICFIFFFVADCHSLLFGQHCPGRLFLPLFRQAGLGSIQPRLAPFLLHSQGLNYDWFKPFMGRPLSFVGNWFWGGHVTHDFWPVTLEGLETCRGFC